MQNNFQTAKNILFTSIFPTHSYNHVSSIMIELSKTDEPSIDLLDTVVNLLLNSINLKHTFLEVNNLILELNKQKNELKDVEDGPNVE